MTVRAETFLGDKNRQTPQSSIPVVGSAENLVGRVSIKIKLTLVVRENEGIHIRSTFPIIFLILQTNLNFTLDAERGS